MAHVGGRVVCYTVERNLIRHLPEIAIMQNLSIGHLAVVAIIVLLLFGAKRIPEIGASLGGGIKAFKKSVDGDSESLQSAAQPAPLSAPSAASAAPREATTTAARLEEVTREPKRLLQ